jgi:hypothetical protein
MANIGRAFTRAAKALSESMKPGEFLAGGKKVVCLHCGSAEFAEGIAKLNTTVMTFVGLDWADKSATTLACTACGQVQWFLKRPERV